MGRVAELARRLSPSSSRAWTSTATLADILGPNARILQPATHVNGATAMRHAAVYACRDLLVRQIATMDVVAYRLNGSVKVPVTPTPQLVANPSPLPSVDAVAWKAQLVDSLVMRGNAFGLVTQVDRNGWPQRIELVHPDVVAYSRPVKSTDEGEWRVAGERVKLWQEGGTLWHLPRFPPPGSPLGLSVLQLAQASIGLGLDAEKFGADWFINGAHPSSLISVDSPNIPDETAKEIKRRVVEATSGREPLVLSNAAKFTPISVTANESQFLDTIKANDNTIAKFFGVPPEKIGGTSGNSLKYANVESYNVSYLIDTVDPLLVLIERGWGALLPAPQMIGFDRSVLLRTDTNARYNSYSTAIATGVLLPNEARALEGRPPIDGGDIAPWDRATPIAPASVPSTAGDK